MRFHLVFFLCLAGFARSAEPVTFPLELGTLETVGAGSRTYDGVKVISKDAVGIKIMHEGGTSRIAYEKLPPGLRQRFAVDPEAAKAQLRKEAEQNAAHDRAVEDAMKTSGQEEAKPASPEGGIPEPAGEGEEESQDEFIARLLRQDKPDQTGRTRTEIITGLRGYINRLDQEIEKLDADMRRRDERNSRIGARNPEYNARASMRGQERIAKQHEKYNQVRKQIHQKLQEATRDLAELEEGG